MKSMDRRKKHVQLLVLFFPKNLNNNGSHAVFRAASRSGTATVQMLHVNVKIPTKEHPDLEGSWRFAT